MIAAIVAVDADWGIGYNGELLERIPEDMKRFKELTTGKYNHNQILMGRKTWESLKEKPLPNRWNCVITASPIIFDTKDIHVFRGIEAAQIFLKIHKFRKYTIPRDIFIIGGGITYQSLLPYCDILYITRIDKHHENVDVYFPDIAADAQWKLMSTTERKEYNGIPYWFETYVRQ